MDMIRTPDERFADLADFPYEPHYLDINGMRVHYVDEGSGEVVLCLHGEPSWSYLYRKMIPILSEKHRVIAPDFIGFGKSDKFTRTADYTYNMHRDTLLEFIEKLDLDRITVVVQDWGGLIGLRVASMIPDKFSRLVIMNTGLPTGDERIPFAFHAWRLFSRLIPYISIGKLIQFATVSRLPAEVVAAYNAPFPGRKYKAGAKAWPLLVPIRPDDQASDELRAAREGLRKWTKPVLIMFSDQDPITRGANNFFLDLIPSAADYPEVTIAGGGHFLQEDKGQEIAGHILKFMGASDSSILR